MVFGKIPSVKQFTRVDLKAALDKIKQNDPTINTSDYKTKDTMINALLARGYNDIFLKAAQDKLMYPARRVAKAKENERRERNPQPAMTPLEKRAAIDARKAERLRIKELKALTLGTRFVGPLLPTQMRRLSRRAPKAPKAPKQAMTETEKEMLKAYKREQAAIKRQEKALIPPEARAAPKPRKATAKSVERQINAIEKAIMKEELRLAKLQAKAQAKTQAKSSKQEFLRGIAEPAAMKTRFIGPLNQNQMRLSGAGNIDAMIARQQKKEASAQLREEKKLRTAQLKAEKKLAAAQLREQKKQEKAQQQVQQMAGARFARIGRGRGQ